MCETWMEQDTRLLGRKLSANWKVCMSFLFSFFSPRSFSSSESGQREWERKKILMMMMACIWRRFIRLYYVGRADCCCISSWFLLPLPVPRAIHNISISFLGSLFSFYFIHAAACCYCSIWMTISFLFFFFYTQQIFSLSLYYNLFRKKGEWKRQSKRERRKICFKWFSQEIFSDTLRICTRLNSYRKREKKTFFIIKVYLCVVNAYWHIEGEWGEIYFGFH